MNGSVVMVYDAYTCENVGNFRVHGGRVTSVSWGLDDQTIVSAGVDGAVYEWTPKTFARNKVRISQSPHSASLIAHTRLTLFLLQIRKT